MQRVTKIREYAEDNFSDDESFGGALYEQIEALGKGFVSPLRATSSLREFVTDFDEESPGFLDPYTEVKVVGVYFGVVASLLLFQQCPESRDYILGFGALYNSADIIKTGVDFLGYMKNR